MAVRSFMPRRGLSEVQSLILEKKLLERHYSFVSVKVVDQTLICRGAYKPTEYSENYEYKIKFKIGERPKVHVITPTIEYNDDIHVYKDLSLCLFYPNDFSFTYKSHLYNTIIPWTHEWFVFYELYLITGKWQHPHVKHNKI